MICVFVRFRLDWFVSVFKFRILLYWRMISLGAKGVSGVMSGLYFIRVVG